MLIVLIGALVVLFVAAQGFTIAAVRRAYPRLAARLRRSRLRGPAVAFLAWLNAAPVLYFATEVPLPHTDGLGGRLLLYPSIVWGFTAFGVTLALGVYAALVAVSRLLTRPIAPGGLVASPTRRRFLQAATGGAVLTAASSSVYAAYVGNDALRVERVTLRHPKLPPGLDGLVIAQISDLHVGSYMAPERLHGYMGLVNRLNPDLTVVTGDIVDNTHEELALATAALARLTAPLGVYTILGNHDHWHDPEAVRRAVREAGVPLLDGDVVTLAGRRPDGERFALIGIDDVAGSPDGTQETLVAAALARVPAAADFRVLLSHRPNVFPDVVDRDVTLTLAGHTHGGQAIFPLPGDRGVTVARLRSPYDHGLFQRGAGWLYVNRGLGVSGLPVRFNCPREVTLITLRCAPQVEASVPVVIC